VKFRVKKQGPSLPYQRAPSDEWIRSFQETLLEAMEEEAQRLHRLEAEEESWIISVTSDLPPEVPWEERVAFARELSERAALEAIA